MRIVLQKVKQASVTVEGRVEGKVDEGLLLLAGFENADQDSDLDWMCKKVVNMRIFNDADDKMNLSIMDVGGDILVVSQFTLHASVKKGNRPSFIYAAEPDYAETLYNSFIEKLEHVLGKPVSTGVFGAMMDVELNNDGPVTIFIDSKNKE